MIIYLIDRQLIIDRQFSFQNDGTNYKTGTKLLENLHL